MCVPKFFVIRIFGMFVHLLNADINDIISLVTSLDSVPVGSLNYVTKEVDRHNGEVGDANHLGKLCTYNYFKHMSH